MPADVATIVASGVRGILNTISVCQAPHVAYVHHLPKHIFWQQLGFWDGLREDGPGYLETLSAGYAELVVKLAAGVLRDYSPVLVHCAGGFGRSANLAAILLAASESITPDEAIERIRQHRKTAPFLRDGFWKAAGGDALVELARSILTQPPKVPQNVSPFLCEGWQRSRLWPAGDVTRTPYVGLADEAEWAPVTVYDAFVDVHEQCGTDGIVYLAHRVSVAEAGRWILHVGHDGGARAFVDGQPVAATAGTLNPAPFQRTRAPVTWAAGEHEIVVALDRDGGRGWGIHVSFEHPEHKPVYPGEAPCRFTRQGPELGPLPRKAAGSPTP